MQHQPIAFEWNGQPIADIREWAKERGEQMVRVRHTWAEPNIFGGRIEDREEITEMPASFYGSMRFGEARNDTYAEIERYDP